MVYWLILKHFNFAPSTKDDNPSDLYNYILVKILDYIGYICCSEDIDKNRDSFLRLAKFGFNRSIVKKAIMTLLYNASRTSMAQDIKDELFKHPVIIEGEAVNVYSLDSKHIDYYLTSADILLFVKLYKLVLYTELFRFEKLSNYLKSIVKICTRLNIPIP